MATNSSQLPNVIAIPKGYAPLNAEGMALANLAAWHQLNIGHTGILAAYPESSSTQPMGSAANPVVASQRPWIQEPTGSIPFDEQGVVPAPAAAQPGLDIPVVKFVCPQGYDGVINYISNNTTNAAFVNGSGDLIWKILINGRPIRNFGAILVQKGTMAQGRQISPIRLFSGDIVTYTVQFAAGAPAGQVICSLSGYFYPSRGIS